MPINHFKKILVVKNRAMGDAIISLGAIEYLRQSLPASKLYIGTPKWTAKLIENLVDEDIVPIKLDSIKDWWIFYKKLNDLEIDCIFEMFQSGRTKKFFTLYSKIKKIPYYAHNHHTKGPVLDQGKIKSNIQRDLDGAWSFFSNKKPIPNYLDFEPKAKVVQNKENILIFGVVATRETKKWALKNYSAIYFLLKEKYPDWKVVIPLSPSQEDQRTKKVLLELGLPRKSFLETPLDQLAIEIAKAKIYLGNDTGIKHLSVCLGLKTYTLFGPEPPTEWHPYDSKKHPYFFIDPLDCRTRISHYCGLNTCNSMICLTNISHLNVWKELEGYIIKLDSSQNN